jgi:hypothetical protein
MDMSRSDDEIELTPEQPDEVRAALEALLGDAGRAVDPWWRAGLDDALTDPL